MTVWFARWVHESVTCVGRFRSVLLTFAVRSAALPSKHVSGSWVYWWDVLFPIPTCVGQRPPCCHIGRG